MNNKQNSRLNMAQRVADTLTQYKSVYQNIAPVNTAVGEFQQIIFDIRTVATEQLAVEVPAITQKKRSVEEKMIDASVRIANALYVVGFETDNKELTNLSGLNDSSFYRLPDNTKLTLARHLYDLAQQYSAELASYGFDGQTIGDTGASITGYNSIIANPMDAITIRKQKTDNLRELFARLNSAMYDKLDKLMVLFKASHPDFYGAYRTARNII